MSGGKEQGVRRCPLEYTRDKEVSQTKTGHETDGVTLEQKDLAGDGRTSRGTHISATAHARASVYRKPLLPAPGS